MRHSQGVGQMAVMLNERYALGFADDELHRVGLYHDLAREWREEDLVRFATEGDLAVSEEELAHPILLHAPVAAAILERAGMDRPQLLAVRHHTLGSEEMGTFGMAIFCADYMEPNRTHLTDEDRALMLEEPTIEMLCVRVIEREWQWRRGEGRAIALASRAFYRHLRERMTQ